MTSKNRFLVFGVGAVVVFFALLPLCRLDIIFYDDWPNHLWQMRYQGLFLTHHSRSADVLNTQQWLGIPFPLFYGFSLFPALGALTRFGAADVMLRLAIFSVWAVQFYSIYRCLTVLKQGRAVALGTATLVSWSIYSLTNLYNRSALPELFAAAFFTISLCLWILFLMESDSRRQKGLLYAFTLMTALFCGAHPIAALYGLSFLFIIITLSLVLQRNAVLSMLYYWRIPAALSIFFFCLALAPWAYVCAKFAGSLRITWYSGYLRFLLPGISRWLILFAPFPLDARSLFSGLRNVSTPYLTAQLNLPLLLIVLFETILIVPKLTALIRTHRRYLLAATGLTIALAILILCSVSGRFAAHVPGPFRMIQFGYRLITYQNALLLLILFLVLHLSSAGTAGAARLRHSVWMICLTIAAVSVIMKWTQGVSSSGRAPAVAPNEETVLRLPESFHSVLDYISAVGTKPLAESIGHRAPKMVLPVDSNSEYWGYARPLKVRFLAPTWVLTNIYTFGWNELWIDGRAMPPDNRWTYDYRLAAKIPAGLHELRYRFSPDRAWVVLRFFSPLGFFGLLALCIATLMPRFHWAGSEVAPKELAKCRELLTNTQSA